MARHVVPHAPINPVGAAGLRARRAQQVDGLSRRSLLRRAVGVGVGLWAVEIVGGSLGFLWSAVALAAPKIAVGTLAELIAANPGLPIAEGFPAYVAPARAFVVLVDAGRGGWATGGDPSGDGVALNVRALSQRCPHLGCRPNPCVADFWFHCPCHQSRYDRLGIKAAGERFGPAPRGMDRYAIEVDERGVLTIDTAKVTLGPLPVVLGQPGLIGPRAENACA